MNHFMTVTNGINVRHFHRINQARCRTLALVYFASDIKYRHTFLKFAILLNRSYFHIIMKQTLLILKLSLYACLIYLFYILFADYDPTSASFRPPFVVWVTDWMNLYIHEAGHLIFKIFGRTIYFLGGSLTQILIPLALVLVIARQRNWYIGAAGFWLGENFVNVSVYIKDAPFRELHLIGRGLIHDWNWLLSNNLDIAEPLADIVSIIGLLICATSIVIGIILSIRDFKWYDEPVIHD
jgi:hypothetical protein